MRFYRAQKGPLKFVGPPDFANFSLTVTGNDVQKIVEAVSRSTTGHLKSLCAPVWELQFSQGTNQLATVASGCNLIFIDQMEYRDASGTLMQLDRALDAQTRRVPVPTNGTIGPLSSY